MQKTTTLMTRNLGPAVNIFKSQASMFHDNTGSAISIQVGQADLLKYSRQIKAGFENSSAPGSPDGWILYNSMVGDGVLSGSLLVRR